MNLSAAETVRLHEQIQTIRSEKEATEVELADVNDKVLLDVNDISN